MKIATWNLNCIDANSGVRGKRIQSELDRVAADVWILTESHPLFAPSGHRLIATSSPAIDRVKGGRWVTIWVRDEMEATEVVLREQDERMAAVRIVRAPYRSVVVFGTVLPWRADTRHAEYRGARVFEHTLREHAKEWDAQMTGEEDTELCIAGDFNQEFRANGPIGTRIGRAALDEILQNSKLTCATGGSQDPLVHRRCGTNIDHILISKGLRVSDVLPESWPESIPVPRRISDHYGISITVADA